MLRRTKTIVSEDLRNNHCEEATLDTDKSLPPTTTAMTSEAININYDTKQKKLCIIGEEEESTGDDDDDHPPAPLVLLDEGEEEEEEEGGSGAIEDEDLFDLVREITPDEETVECGTDNCSDPAVATWTTNNDPNFMIHLCQDCEDEQMGEYDNNRVVPNTNYTTTNNEDRVDMEDGDDEQEDGDGDGNGDTTQHCIMGVFSEEEDKLLWTQQSKSKKRISSFDLSEQAFKKTRSFLQIQKRWTRDGFKKYVTNNFGDDAYSNLHKRWYPTTHDRWEEDIRQREGKKQQQHKQQNQQRAEELRQRKDKEQQRNQRREEEIRQRKDEKQQRNQRREEEIRQQREDEKQQRNQTGEKKATKTTSSKEEEIKWIRTHPLIQALVKENQVNAASNGQPLFQYSRMKDEIEKRIQIHPSKDLNEASRILVVIEVVGVRGYTSDESRSISGLKDKKCLRINEVKFIKPHTTYQMSRKECGGSYNDDGSSMQHVVIDKVECYINRAGNKVMNSIIIPALEDHPSKPLCTHKDGNTLVIGGSLLISGSWYF